MQSLDVVILAAGKGTRMHSARPKVLHALGGKPLLQHVVDTARKLGAGGIEVVIGHEAERIEQALAGQALHFVRQERQLGTGHAVLQALPGLNAQALALILYGDVPLVREATLREFLQLPDANSMAVLTCRVADPTGLGRIVRDDDGAICRIVEEKDASAAERGIEEINSGIMAVPVALLQRWLPRIEANNAQREYYLTDLVGLALADDCRVHTLCCEDEVEITGVNNRVQLAQLERRYQARRAEALMLAGVTLRDPARIDLRGELEAGVDTEIDVNVIVEGVVSLGDGVHIGPNCVLKNCRIGAGSRIDANCVVEDAQIGEACSIGPFARIRPGTVLEQAAKIGNFVEIKNAHVGHHSKVNHLSYVGDSELGSEVNIGAGTITCNYDGVNKARTIIGDKVFIGSNTALVAPVNVASGATVAAGSVITENVGQEQLAVARGRQRNIDGWKRPVKNKPTG